MSCRISHDWYTIEEQPDGGAFVYAHGYYGPSSVLAGRYGRQFIDGYHSVKEAQQMHPDAEVSGSTKHLIDPDPGPVEPAWFDDRYAGERWNNDY